MHHHDSLVFPHETNRKPQNDAGEKRPDVPRGHTQSGQAISEQLDNSRHPFDDIDRLEFSGCHEA